jgi:hypothetical protein
MRHHLMLLLVVSYLLVMVLVFRDRRRAVRTRDHLEQV